MKIIDRYVILSFLRNYLISFFVLVGMYVVLDMIFKFDEFVEVKDRVEAGGLSLIVSLVAYIADYYVYQIPMYFAQLSGMIAVVAAAFTLLRMTRFNELTAMLSAGVPLLRVAAPIILVGLLLQGLLLVDQELVIPNIIPKLVRSPDHAMASEEKNFAIEAMRADDNGKLFASRYYPNTNPPRMEVVDVVYQDEKYMPLMHIRADRAEWDAKNRHWKLVGGRVHRNIAPYSAQEVQSAPLETYQSSINPTEIQLYRSGGYVELLSTASINQLLERPRSYGRLDLLRVKHSRAAQVVVNVLLLLLTISCVLTREPQQLKAAASRCVILCGACLSVVFMGHELSAQPPPHINPAQWPALMAWLPIFTFGPLSVWLLDRIKT